MRLSQRAQAFLARATRQPCPRDRAQVRRLMEQEQLPVFEQILAFQERYGGIDLRKGREDGFLLGIVLDDGLNGFPLDDGRYLFECADHPRAQLRFLLDQMNVFYVSEYPLAERFETYLESEALFDEMGRQRGWHARYIGQAPRDDRRIDAAIGLPPLPEASDAYLKWWGTDRVGKEDEENAAKHAVFDMR